MAMRTYNEDDPENVDGDGDGEAERRPDPEAIFDPLELPIEPTKTVEEVLNGARLNWSPFNKRLVKRRPETLTARARDRAEFLPEVPEDVARVIDRDLLAETTRAEARATYLALYELAQVQNTYEATQSDLVGTRAALKPIRQERDDAIYELMKEHGFAAAYLARNVGLTDRGVREAMLRLMEQRGDRRDDLLHTGRRPDLKSDADLIVRAALEPVLAKALDVIATQGTLSARMLALRARRNELLHQLLSAGVSVRRLGNLTDLLGTSIHNISAKLTASDPVAFPRFDTTPGRRRVPDRAEIGRTMARWGAEETDDSDGEQQRFVHRRVNELRSEMPPRSGSRTARDNDEATRIDPEDTATPRPPRYINQTDDPLFIAHWQWAMGWRNDVMMDTPDDERVELEGRKLGPEPAEAHWDVNEDGRKITVVDEYKPPRPPVIPQ